MSCFDRLAPLPPDRTAGVFISKVPAAGGAGLFVLRDMSFV